MIDILDLYRNLHGALSEYNKKGKKAERVIEIAEGYFLLERRERIPITEVYRVVERHPAFAKGISRKYIRKVLLNNWEMENEEILTTRRIE
jgi:hypothetical protein